MFCFGFMFVWEDLVIGIRKGLVLWFLEMVSVFVIYVMGVLVQLCFILYLLYEVVVFYKGVMMFYVIFVVIVRGD